ncbi:hypothetical protein BGZ96_000891 [Linnemannia gamsii]|uniref:C2H2-type domain-containing protein n=1 Tax=Linnemannia gamsii TaxID=64522 RepID=A0ABQ7JN62_9FUNG|nr:hypothetical protein BGZ96_000891 [Linnemannia gamsii]
MAKKREVRCQAFDVNACTIVHASKAEKKKHDREYHSNNSAIGSREGFYNVVINRDFSKTPPYYYCTGAGCKTMTNRLPSMKDHIPKCRFVQWTVVPLTAASPQSVPTASQLPSNSHQPTGRTKRKAADMASSAPSSASPSIEVDTSTSLLPSMPSAVSQTSVFQSLATQLELYMKETDLALVNSQTALEQSQIVLQQSKVALQQATTSIVTLEKKVDDINVKWENLTDLLALQASQQLAIQGAVRRVSVDTSLAIAKMLRDINMEFAKKNDDAIARNNDVLAAISQQRADSQETTRRLDGMSLARLPLSCDFSEFGK